RRAEWRQRAPGGPGLPPEQGAGPEAVAPRIDSSLDCTRQGTTGTGRKRWRSNPDKSVIYGPIGSTDGSAAPISQRSNGRGELPEKAVFRPFLVDIGQNVIYTRSLF